MPPLFGFLLKQHENSSMFSWGRRYVRVDDKRGVLWYGKSANARPSAVLPLCDVSVLEPPASGAPDSLSFIVCCPPMRLTLRAADPVEFAVWVSSLRECASEWRRRTAEEMRRL